MFYNLHKTSNEPMAGVIFASKRIIRTGFLSISHFFRKIYFWRIYFYYFREKPTDPIMGLLLGILLAIITVLIEIVLFGILMGMGLGYFGLWLLPTVWVQYLLIVITPIIAAYLKK